MADGMGASIGEPRSNMEPALHRDEFPMAAGTFQLEDAVVA